MLWFLIALALVVAALILWSAYVSRGVERWIPMDGRQVVVPGARIHVVEMGPADAPAIVMIHGIMSQLRVFTYALAGRLAKDHRVLVMDRPGWGYSTRTGPRLDLAGQADAIAAAIAALGLEKPLLVGHSMGGAVSLALALRHPEAVRGLGLIAPLTQPIDAAPAPLKGLVVPAPLRPIIAWTLAVPLSMRTGKAKTAEVFAPDAVPEDFPIKAGGALAIRPASFQQGCYELEMAPEAIKVQAPRYGEIVLPVAILYGRQDALLDPELHGGKTASAVQHGKVDYLDGGHMLPVTHVDATEAWLRTL
ncbi:alpha/beta hydrolase [Sphingomonas sp. HITSZ_GF]|uniref:alpha/beta fold hydrolase n=1 Tax=Sphingomonas sp. HITSZ_GF TaxID=3037247 RepID=UPI00240D81D3|nr:alpha/beta hydrolase [Sphingomonas sp. HITSZ_GF]MDG2533560.1 alpha/beta hydrolase [Sphingomonas sp. HITSZ_GF]